MQLLRTSRVEDKVLARWLDGQYGGAAAVRKLGINLCNGAIAECTCRGDFHLFDDEGEGLALSVEQRIEIFDDGWTGQHLRHALAGTNRRRQHPIGTYTQQLSGR